MATPETEMETPEEGDSHMDYSIEAPVASLNNPKVGDTIPMRVTSIDGDTATLEPVNDSTKPSSIEQAAGEFDKEAM